MSQLLAQIMNLQNKVNSLSDAQEFYDPESGSSFGATHVPSQLSTIPGPRTMPRCDSGLPHDTLNFIELQETCLNEYLLEKDHPLHSSSTQRIRHHLLEFRPDITGTTERRES